MARTRRRPRACARRHRRPGRAAGNRLPAGPAAAAPRRAEELSRARHRQASRCCRPRATCARRSTAGREGSPRPAPRSRARARSFPISPDGGTDLRAATYFVLRRPTCRRASIARVQEIAEALPADDTSLPSERATRHRAQPSRLGEGRPRPHRARSALARAVSRVRRRALPGHADDRLPARSFRACARAGSQIDDKDCPLRRPDDVGRASRRSRACLRRRCRSAAPTGGLPIGVQIVGPYLEDRTPLAFAALMEREFGGFVPPLAFAG